MRPVCFSFSAEGRNSALNNNCSLWSVCACCTFLPEAIYVTNIYMRCIIVGYRLLLLRCREVHLCVCGLCTARRRVCVCVCVCVCGMCPCVSVSVWVSVFVCPHDRTKTAETIQSQTCHRDRPYSPSRVLGKSKVKSSRKLGIRCIFSLHFLNVFPVGKRPQYTDHYFSQYKKKLPLPILNDCVSLWRHSGPFFLNIRFFSFPSGDILGDSGPWDTQTFFSI